MGTCPPDGVIRCLTSALHATQPGRLVETPELSSLLSTSKPDPAVAAGVLAVPISRARDDYLLWFKPEARRIVRWAGDPDDFSEKRSDGRLRPRASFDIFLESVEGRALDFEPWERSLAERVGVVIAQVARRLDEVSDAISESARAELKFTALFLHSPYAMAIVDEAQEALELVNPAFERLLGEAREALGRPLSEVVPAASPEAVEHLLGAGDPRLSWTIESRRDGTRIVEPSAVRLDTGSSPRLLLLTLVDETAHVMAERALAANAAALERANQELDRFVALASHDLRAPLRAIRNLAEWIQEDTGDRLPEPSRGHLDRLMDRVEYLDQLFHDLLKYARAGREPETRAEADLEPLIRECFDLVASELDFRLVLEAPEEPVPVRLVELKTILRNLIGNAIQHHDRSAGVIQVRARREGERLELEVEDDGPGIPQRFAERIFELFATVAPETAGAGMGLAVVRRLVTRDGGRIDLVPRDARGTLFRVTLPMA